MIKNRKTYVSFLLSLIALTCSAQFNYTENSQTAQNAILSLSFNSYDSIKSNATSNEKGIYYWLDGYRCFVESFTSVQNQNSDSVIDLIQVLSAQISDLPSNQPFFYVGQIDLHLFLSFLFFRQDKFLKAFREYIIANDYIKKGKNIYPDFEHFNKYQIIHYTIKELINEQLGIQVNNTQNQKTKIIDNFKSLLDIENEVYARELTLINFLLLNYHFGNDLSSFIDGSQVGVNYAKLGPIESLISAEINKKLQKFDVQLSSLCQASELHFFEKLNLLRLEYANGLLNQQNDSAIYYFKQFELYQQNQQGVQYARFKSSMFYFLQSNTKWVDSLHLLISTSSHVYTNEDKQAIYEIKNAKYWTKELVKSRLLFDGGEYTKALQVLLLAKNNVHYYSKEQKLEYSYRLARIYHKLGNFDRASTFYQMAISSNLDEEFYYPAYAAYYLGNIYYDRNDKEDANYYFSKCKELNSPIYKQSVHRKASLKLNKKLN